MDALVTESNTTYSWVARKTGIKESTISMQRKRGTDPGVTDAEKMAEAFGVTCEYLTTGIEPEVAPLRLKELVRTLKRLNGDDLDNVVLFANSLLDRAEKKREENEANKAEFAV